MTFDQIVFLALAFVSTASALGMIAAKDPVHSALLLVFTFFNLAGIYVLLGAEFLAAIQVLVYAGAIVVLFLFVMMLLQVRPGPSLNPLRFFQSGFGPLLAILFLVEVVTVVFSSNFVLNGGRILDPNNRQAAQVVESVRYSVETSVPIADAQGVTRGGGIGLLESTASGHSALLGKEIYSTYLYPFEIASLILLVAAIGAIVIARRSLEHDTDEDGDTDIGRGISLAGPMPGSPQALEMSKQGRIRRGKERTLVMKKK